MLLIINKKIFVVYKISFGLDHDDVGKAKQKPTACKAICMMALFRDCNYQNPSLFLFRWLIREIVI